MKRKTSALETEIEQLRQLFELVYKRPQAEAFEIFNRIRESGNPATVLQAVRDADLLVRSPRTASPLQNPRLEDIDRDALLASAIRVPARPWTAVAGDGLVSELVSSLFALDHFAFPFLHKDAFLNDMRYSTPEKAKYCSPFLVNVICALRAVCAALGRFPSGAERVNRLHRPGPG